MTSQSFWSKLQKFGDPSEPIRYQKSEGEKTARSKRGAATSDIRSNSPISNSTTTHHHPDDKRNSHLRKSGKVRRVRKLDACIWGFFLTPLHSYKRCHLAVRGGHLPIVNHDAHLRISTLVSEQAPYLLSHQLLFTGPLPSIGPHPDASPIFPNLHITGALAAVLIRRPISLISSCSNADLSYSREFHIVVLGTGMFMLCSYHLIP